MFILLGHSFIPNGAAFEAYVRLLILLCLMGGRVCCNNHQSGHCGVCSTSKTVGTGVRMIYLSLFKLPVGLGSFFELDLARYLIRIEVLRVVRSMYMGLIRQEVTGALGKYLADMVDECELPTPGRIDYPLLFQIPRLSSWHNTVGILAMFGYKCCVPNIFVVYSNHIPIQEALVVWNGLRNGIGVDTEEFILSDTMYVDNEEPPQETYHLAMYHYRVQFNYGNNIQAIADSEFGVLPNERA